MITIRMSNSLDPDQAQHFVWPHLVPSRLQKLSADDTSTGSHRLEKYLNIQYCLKKSLKIKLALKST